LQLYLPHSGMEAAAQAGQSYEDTAYRPQWTIRRLVGVALFRHSRSRCLLPACLVSTAHPSVAADTHEVSAA